MLEVHQYTTSLSVEKTLLCIGDRVSYDNAGAIFTEVLQSCSPPHDIERDKTL